MTRSIAVVFPEWMQTYGQHGEEHAFVMFEHVVRAVTEVSPLVEVENIGTIVMASRGPSRYFGGDVLVAQHLYDVCVAADNRSACGVGIADSRFAATAAAYLAHSRGTPCVIDSRITAEFIGGLPVASLARIGGISNDTVDLLQRLGLRTCSAVRAIGEAALIDRFGIEGKRLYALTTGHEVQYLAPGAPPSNFSCSIEFESPLVNAHHVVAATHRTISNMAEAIASHGQQCVRLLISCETDHAETASRIWGEPRGLGAAAIMQRLSYQVDGWLTDIDAIADAPTSGIVRVSFEPIECREVLVTQQLLWGGYQENIERASRAVSMVLAVGDGTHVSVPRWQGGRDLSSVYELVPASMVDLTDAHDAQTRVELGRGVARDWSGSIPRPSPTSVASVPPVAQVFDVHGDEVMVTGRHELSGTPACLEVSGHSYEIMRIAGPWPVEERWWDARRRRRHVRLQFLVKNARGRLTVFLVGLENRTWTLLARYE